MMGEMDMAASSAARHKKSRATDGTAYFTPAQTASRWGFNCESVRRLVRNGGIEAVILGRRILIPIAEIERLENEGRTARAA
jgi:excisionase family DNA binding protein